MTKYKKLIIRDKAFNDLCEFLESVTSDIFILADFLESLLKVYNLESKILIPKVIHSFNNGFVFKCTIKIIFLNLTIEEFNIYGTLKYLIVERSINKEKFILLYENIKA